MGWHLVTIFIVLILLRVPIAIALSAAAAGAAFLTGSIPVEVVFHRITGGLSGYVLLAIPFFILAGNLMNNCGITNKIFTFANKLVGYIPGGLAHANVVASIIFSGMSGSAVADAGGLGLVEMKAMNDEGYEPEFGAAVTAASATIGPIIPPSVPMVVYGVMAEVSIGALFLGGFLPGLFMGLVMMIIIYYQAIKNNYPRIEKFDFGELWDAFKDAFLPLLTPVIIIGGIMSGIVTPTEAAVVATIYALFLGTVVYRRLGFKDVFKIIYESMETTATVTFIIAGAASFAWLIAIEGIPAQLAMTVGGISDKWMFLLIFNIFFLILGTFMETLSIEVIMVPVLVPIMKVLGLDPVHMGVVLVLNLMIGLITPPVGMSLFITSKVGGVKLESLYKAVLPFLLPLIAVLFIITFFSDIVTWLPSIFLG
ncbi:TRAP transporter large permease [Halocella sp. SP3-1]|uniref:TRAP transporter large permease n=1 Tax=Halocella sp. SP3-1 TaxID=2382161 RepID=UPI000F752541|nr:TRAP transporter large permease [Halocella sp. SP3-1]AZO96586.1 TRAP transporter large permease [Halocella sp. SP3-1]MTI60045.1 TRAP transporter large permease [Bacillota bacterium]